MSDISLTHSLVQNIISDYRKDSKIDNTVNIDKLTKSILKDGLVTDEELFEIKDLLKSINYKMGKNEPVSDKIEHLFKLLIEKSQKNEKLITQINKIKAVYSGDVGAEFITSFNSLLKSARIKGDIRDILLDLAKPENIKIIKQLQEKIGVEITGIIDNKIITEVQKRQGLKENLNLMLKDLGIQKVIKFPDNNEISEAIKLLQKEMNLEETGNFESVEELNLLSSNFDLEIKHRSELKSYFNELLDDLLGSDVKINNLTNEELTKGLREIQKKLGIPETGNFKDPDTLRDISEAVDQVIDTVNASAMDTKEQREPFTEHLNKIFLSLYNKPGFIKDTSDDEIKKGITELQKRLGITVNDNFMDEEVLKKLDQAVSAEANRKAILRDYINKTLKNTFNSEIQIKGINEHEISKGIKELQRIGGINPNGNIDETSLKELDQALLRKRVMDSLSTKLGVKIPENSSLSTVVNKIQSELGIPQTGKTDEASLSSIIDEIVRRESILAFVNKQLSEQFGSDVKINSIKSSDMGKGFKEIQKLLNLKEDGTPSQTNINQIMMELQKNFDHIAHINNLFRSARCEGTQISKIKQIPWAMDKLREIGYKDVSEIFKNSGAVVGLEKGYTYDDDIDVERYEGKFDTIGAARGKAYELKGNYVIARTMDGKYDLLKVDENLSSGDAIGKSKDWRIRAQVVEFVGYDDNLLKPSDDASAWKNLGNEIVDLAKQARENIKISANWVGENVRYAAEFYGDLQKSDSKMSQIVGYLGTKALDGVSIVRESIEDAEGFYSEELERGNKVTGYVGGFLTMFASPVKNAAGILDYKISDEKRAQMFEGLGMDVGLIIAGGGIAKLGGVVIKGTGKLVVGGGKLVLKGGKLTVKGGKVAGKHAKNLAKTTGKGIKNIASKTAPVVSELTAATAYVTVKGVEVGVKLGVRATKFIARQTVNASKKMGDLTARWLQIGKFSIKGMAKANETAAKLIQKELKAATKEIEVLLKANKGKFDDHIAVEIWKKLEVIGKKYGMDTFDNQMGKIASAKNPIKFIKSLLSTASGDATGIAVKGKVGVAHELVHAFQIIQGRATALSTAAMEKHAVRKAAVEVLKKQGKEATEEAVEKTIKEISEGSLDKNFKTLVETAKKKALDEIKEEEIPQLVKKLTKEESQKAYKAMVEPIENQAVSRFESAAYQSTGLGGTYSKASQMIGKGAKGVKPKYTEGLNSMIDALGDAYTKAQAPVPKFGLGARIYGKIPVIAGSGNLRMGLNFSAAIGVPLVASVKGYTLDDDPIKDIGLRMITFPVQLIPSSRFLYDKYAKEYGLPETRQKV